MCSESTKSTPECLSGLWINQGIYLKFYCWLWTSHCLLGSVSANHFAGNLTKIFFSWILLLFQKTRCGLSAVCFFNDYFKKGILRKVDLPTYKTPSELLQGDAWTSSGIVNGNFCKEEQKKVNVFFKSIKVAQENIDFSFHQELIFHKGKYGASTQQWTKSNMRKTVFKNIKVIWSQSLTSNFLKTVPLKVYLVNSWMHCLVYVRE